MGKTKTAFVSGAPEEPEKPKEVAGPEGKKPFDKAQGKKATEGKPEKAKKQAKEKPEKVHITGLKGGQRIKTIDVGPIITEAPKEEVKAPGGPEGLKARRAPKIRGKKYKEAKAKVDRNKLYPIDAAVKLVKVTSYSKFDGTVELHINVKKEGLSVKVSLPYSGGKEKKVEIADDKTIEKLAAGKIDFDVLLATPDMMPKLVPFAKVLGPRGLMPNPKNETLIKDKKAAEKFSTNTVTLKAQKDFPVIHAVVGKVSQDDKELVENIQAIIEAVGSKQILKAYLSPTMGPSVKLLL